MSNTDQKLKELIKLVEKLRAPGGCDWDRKQTPETLIPYLLEESHEVAEAILDNEPVSYTHLTLPTILLV